ncbi:hypothetical protein BH10ACT7_BH10ACT7_09920 [soil metagenome]
MRWDNLFDDLESQLEREVTAEELDVGVEEERLRLSRLSLRDRLQAIRDAPAPADRELTLTLLTAARLRVRPVAIGRDWLSGDIVDDSARRAQCIVPLSAIAGVSVAERQVSGSLRAIAAQPEKLPPLSARLGIAFVLRDLCRRRHPLEFTLTTGGLHGTIDRVGRDHIDVAVHEPGIPRRSSLVSEYRVVPLDQVILVTI